MRIAVLVKQVPAFTEMELDDHGRLIRAGLPLELNPYCRRAVSQAVELARARPVGPAAPAGPAGPGPARPAGPGPARPAGPATVTVVTLGPPSAEDALREAIAWGLERGVDVDGLLVTDPAFAGSDTLATARALAAALELAGPFDLVLAGRNSVDSETGQVPPELAELLGLPFLTGVRTLEVDAPDGRPAPGGPDGGTGGPGATTVRARCEHDDGWVEAEVDLPALLSCAERLIEPAKVDTAGRAAVPAGRIRRLAAADLGPGPWGEAGSPTTVGAVRIHEVDRECVVLAGPVEEQVRVAVDVLIRRGALAGLGAAADAGPGEDGGGTIRGGRVPGVGMPGGVSAFGAGGAFGGGGGTVPRPGNPAGAAVAVVLEADRPHVTQELLSAAADLAEELDGHVVALAGWPDAAADAPRLGAWGADEVVVLAPDASPETSGPEPALLTAGIAPSGTPVGEAAVALAPEDVAAGVVEWAADAGPWAVLVPSTAWGREVAGRAAARLGAGLTGDAVGFDVEDGRLVAWKPAFGGQVLAAITASSPVQM